jgi:hypothetical protein
MSQQISNDDVIEVKLNQREVNLLLEYAYPFENEEEQLHSFQSIPGIHILKVDEFYLSRLIGDLVYSAKEIENESLLKELDRLCTAMELAEQGKARKLFLVK